MEILSTILAVTLAIVCLVSSIADFKVIPQVVQTMERLRLPMRLIPVLGVAKFAASVGLLTGLAIHSLLVFTALCLSIYFVLATWFHVRVRDEGVATAPAATLALVSIVTLISSL